MNKPLMKEFKLEGLFNQINQTAKVKNFKKIKKKNKVCTLPATSASTTNNMMAFYVSEEEHDVLNNCITMNSNGHYGIAFYQKHDFAIAQNSYAIFLKNKQYCNEHVYLYITTILQKILVKFNYQYKPSWERVKKESVSLPVKSLEDTEPDYEYMKNYIKEIQNKVVELKIKEDQEEMKRLKALTNNISHKELSNVLEKEFLVKDIFNHIGKTRTTKKFLKSKYKTDECNIPATSASTINNMLTYFVSSKEHKLLNNCISVNSNGHFGISFYQSRSFAISQDSYALILKNENYVSKNVYLYLNTLLRKILKKYNYQNKSSWNKIKNESVCLPIKSLEDTEPDYEYMDQYIQNMQLKYINEKHKANMEYIEQIKQIIKMTNQPKAS